MHLESWGYFEYPSLMCSDHSPLPRCEPHVWLLMLSLTDCPGFLFYPQACLPILRDTCSCSEMLAHAQDFFPCSGVLVYTQGCLHMFTDAYPCWGLFFHAQGCLAMVRVPSGSGALCFSVLLSWKPPAPPLILGAGILEVVRRWWHDLRSQPACLPYGQHRKNTY